VAPVTEIDPDERAPWRARVGMSLQLSGTRRRALAAATSLSYQDYLVLAVLAEEGGQARPLDLVRELGWEKSRVSHHVSRMVERGLVTRAAIDSDRRGAVVVSTASGRRAAAAARSVHDEVVRKHFLDVATERELATIRRVAERVQATLADPPDGVRQPAV
jgi:DNA-binding MarR family transcriptional regulator